MGLCRHAGRILLLVKHFNVTQPASLIVMPSAFIQIKAFEVIFDNISGYYECSVLKHVTS